MSVFSKIVSQMTSPASTRVDEALVRHNDAMERLARAAEKMAFDTTQVAAAAEQMANLNAQRLGVQQAEEVMARVKQVNGELVVESNTDLAALLAPVVVEQPALPAPAPAVITVQPVKAKTSRKKKS